MNVDNKFLISSTSMLFDKNEIVQVTSVLQKVIFFVKLKIDLINLINFRLHLQSMSMQERQCQC